MADEQADRRAPGWKRDPSGRFAGRYWNGAAWTEHVVTQDRVPSTDPVPQGPPPPAGQPAPHPAPSPAPEAGPGPRAGGWRGWPLWARLALPLAVLVGIVAAVSANDTGSPGPTSGGAVAARTVFLVGEVARTGDFEVTVYGVQDPQVPGEFLRPSAGSHYVSVDLQVANKGSGQQSFSSLLLLHLVDGANRQFSATVAADISPAPPDGEIPTGEAIRGITVFEVPDGTTGLRLRAQGSLKEAGVFFTLA